ncbi:MAG: membrane protein insertion efficiency factor YidD [Pseudomonadota bacterium]
MASATHSPGMASWISLRLIGAYQRWISPYKGFRCAHSILHGGTGCSGYAKAAIREHGIWSAIAPIRQRFRDCRAAMITLNQAPPEDSRDDEPGTPPKRKKQQGERFCTKTDCTLAACEAPASCCASGTNAKAAGGAGICAGIGEGVGGACGGILGGIGCCGS